MQIFKPSATASIQKKKKLTVSTYAMVNNHISPLPA